MFELVVHMVNDDISYPILTLYILCYTYTLSCIKIIILCNLISICFYYYLMILKIYILFYSSSLIYIFYKNFVNDVVYELTLIK